ncbi:MAG: hypothetical protein ABWZ88_19080 [Variovorax sp.]
MKSRTFPFSALALTAAAALLAAGCSSTANKPADAGAAPQAAAPAPPAPPPKPKVEGMDYDELAGVLGDGAGKGLKQDLVGKTVTLSLTKPSGRGAPAGTWVASDGDSTYFRCRAVGSGFSGGEVVTKIRDYRYVAKPLQRIVDLDRCAVAVAAEPARPAAAAAATTAAPAPSSAGAGTVGAGKPGMDARGNVVDSSKVEAGSGRTVKGINDYEGEITGNPGAGSKFTRLQIGMSSRQVTDLIGPPTDQGAYVTGKAFIPFYFGGDRHRYEMTYKGQGRLVFAGGGMGDFTSGNLIWIIHNPNETGYR